MQLQLKARSQVREREGRDHRTHTKGHREKVAYTDNAKMLQILRGLAGSALKSRVGKSSGYVNNFMHNSIQHYSNHSHTAELNYKTSHY